MERFEIRRATQADARTLATMRADSAFERHGGDAAERARYARLCEAFFAGELTRGDSFLRSWIAFRRNEIAGSASLAISRTLPRYGMPFGGFDGRIRDVYVVPNRRAMGVGTALVETAIAEARALRVDRLTLGASEMGRPLYEKLGFVLKPDEMVYNPEP